MAFGYLSVLLIYLCVSGEIRVNARSKFPGGTLGQLVSAATEFLLYHQQVDYEIRRMNGEADVKQGFAARLQEVVNKLKMEESLD